MPGVPYARPVTTVRRWGRPLLSLGSLAAAVVVAMVLLSPSGPGTARSTRSSSPTPSASPTPLSPAEEYAQAALRLIERHALMRDAGTWDQIEHDTMSAVTSARSTAETHSAISVALLRAAGPLARFTAPEEVIPPAEALPVVVTASGGIGRVVIVSADEQDPTAASARAAQITEAIDMARPKVSCGWVIDLQQTASPNDWGAVAGIAPFLHEGPAFKIEDLTHQASQVSIAMGSVFFEGRPLVVSPGSTFRNTQPVAVLQSPMTSATGEGLLRALRRTGGVRTFGFPAGSMPITEAFSLADGAQIVLPVGQVVDDDGKPSKHLLMPMKETDKPDTEAVRWLRSQCRGS